MEPDADEPDGDGPSGTVAPARVAGAGPAPGGPADPVIAALEELGDALEAHLAHARALAEQVRALRADRAHGRTWRELVAGQQDAGVLGDLGQLVVVLTGAGATLRRALAAALVAEGASTAEVAVHFGVSRQRVFRLLQGRARPVD